MKIELRLLPEALAVVTATLQPVYNTKVHTRRHKATLSIALDVVSKLDKKFASVKGLDSLGLKKQIKITFKHHEADMLELLLIQEIKGVKMPYVRQQIQKTIDDLNQKLA